MTGKRFTIDVETENYENAYFENDNFLCYEDDYDTILQKMNELHEEIQELKHENTQYDILITNNQLAYIDLEKENEQLKERNEFLKKQLDRVCSENEMMGDKLKKIGRIL